MGDDNQDQANDQGANEGTDVSTPAELREAAKRGNQAQAELEAAKRENAMLRAGVDLDSAAGKYFLAGYDGELDSDAIKAEATKIPGLIRAATDPEANTEGDEGDEGQTEQPPARRQPTAEELERDQMNRDVGAEAAGATPPGSPDPYDEGYAAFETALKTGKRRETAAAEVINRVMEAGIQGDERVLIEE